MMNLETLNDMPAYRAFMMLYESGHYSNPRDKGTMEVVGYTDKITYPFHSFNCRHDNLDYIKKEFQWYLKADPFDDSICKHASTWETIIQPNGRIFSNYGYYWFALRTHSISSYNYIINTLKADPLSRQAYIPMLSYAHTFEGNKDVVCTKSIGFRILSDQLHMFVDMRSSDLAIGASIDWPCFNWLHDMVCCDLEIEKGDFIFKTDSLHIYEAQFDYATKVLESTMDDVTKIEYPAITDTKDLIECKFESEFGQWLTTVKL